MTSDEILAVLAEIEADLDDERAELRQTTVGYRNANWKTPPAGTHWSNGELSHDAAIIKLEELKAALRASASASVSPSVSHSISPSPSLSPSPSQSHSISPSPSRSASLSSSPSPSAQPPPTGGIPRFGYATGAIFATWDAATRNYVLDGCKANARGERFAVRFDCWTDDAVFYAMVDGCLARGLTPWIVSYGTTGPTSVKGLMARVAARYKGKDVYYTGPNEMDLHGWTPNQSADFQVALYKEITAADPSAAGRIGTGGHWKGGAGLAEFAKAYVARAKGSFKWFTFHGYDDPTVHASWDVWDHVFPGGYYPEAQTVKGVLNAAGMVVPIVSDECGSKATGQGQWDAIKRLLDQSTINRCQGSYIFSFLIDYDPNWQVVDKTASGFAPRVAYTKYVEFMGGV